MTKAMWLKNGAWSAGRRSTEKNVVRMKPEPGDVVILVGGRTGRDGCGGATGSSREQDEKRFRHGAEVQKSNPSRKEYSKAVQRCRVSRMIKKCNDFGAGGVSVAVGELADGLDIDLDSVPTKYEGLDGTELAISNRRKEWLSLFQVKTRMSLSRLQWKRTWKPLRSLL